MSLTVATHAPRRPGRLGMALGLLGLLPGVTTPGGSARAGDEPAPTVAAVPDDSVHLKAATMGAVVVRPAATLRRLGSDQMAPLARSFIGQYTGRLAAWLRVDPTRPGFRQVEAGDIEAITVGVWMKQARVKSTDPAQPDTGNLTACCTGCVVRLVAATDWPAILEQWGFEVEEIRGCHAPYYRLRLPPETGYRLPLFAYLPDDRTLVVHDSEAWVRPIVAGAAPQAPPFLRGADWQEAGRGLAAAALDNRDGQILDIMTGMLQVDGLLVGTVFMGVERWVASVADADEIVVSARATTRNPLAAGVLGWGLGKLVDLARAEFKVEQMVDPAVARAVAEANAPPDAAANPAATLDRLQARMDQGALARLRVAVDGSMVRVGSAGFGTYAEVGRMLLIAFADQVGTDKPVQPLQNAAIHPDAAKP